MADFKFNCPGCGQKMRASDDMIGDHIECPICRRMLDVPAPLSDIPPATSPSETIQCAFCSGSIPLNSVFCDLCGKRQEGASETDQQSNINPPAVETKPPIKLPAPAVLILVAIIAATAITGLILFKDPRQIPPQDSTPVTVEYDLQETIQKQEAEPPDEIPLEIEVVTAPPAIQSVPPAPTPPPKPAPPPTKTPPPAPKPVAPPTIPAKQTPSESDLDAAKPPPSAEDDIMAEFNQKRNKYQSVLDDINSNYKARVVQAQTNYIANLDKIEQILQDKGELMGVLTMRKEKESFLKTESMPPKISMTESSIPELTKLKEFYNQQLEALEKDRDMEIGVRTQQYDNHLVVLERRLTQAGKIEQALQVHEERERVKPKISLDKSR